eukprot:1092216-Amphidinium_carterae.1
MAKLRPRTPSTVRIAVPWQTHQQAMRQSLPDVWSKLCGMPVPAPLARILLRHGSTRPEPGA